MNKAAPALEIPYSVCSCPTPNALIRIAVCPTSTFLLGIV